MPISAPKTRVDPFAEAIEFRSDLSDRDYALWIRLPQSYRNGSLSYPVMVVLDAEVSFGQASEIAILEFAGSHAPWGRAVAPIPEFIVVGVALPSTPPDPLRRNFEYMPQLRDDDFAPPMRQSLGKLEELLGRGPTFGGAATFLEILRQEILPGVDRHYRTDGSRKVLVGISASGCFGAFALFSQPTLFTDYILASPALPEEIFRMEAAWAANHDDLRARVLLTAGERELEEPLSIVSGTTRFAELLRHRKYASLRLDTWIIPGASHVQTLAPSISRGLSTFSE